MAKILLVEDDKILQKMYQDKFGTTNYELVVASDGEEAIKMALEEKPNFILLDIMLPKVSGIQVLRTLKAEVETRHIPVAVFSVIPQDDPILEGSSEILKQIVGYYRKDESSPSEIVEKIKEYLK